jgi:hypothetical protein
MLLVLVFEGGLHSIRGRRVSVSRKFIRGLRVGHLDRSCDMSGHQDIPHLREAVVFHVSLPLELRDLGPSDIAGTFGGFAGAIALDKIINYLCPVYILLENFPRHFLIVTLLSPTLLQSLPLPAVLFGASGFQRLECFVGFLFRLELQELRESPCLLNVYGVQFRRQLSRGRSCPSFYWRSVLMVFVWRKTVSEEERTMVHRLQN